MKTHHRESRLVCWPLAGMLCAVLLAQPARAQFDFPSFPNATGLNVVGNASISSASRLRLTTNSNSQFGAAWYATQQSVGQGFSTTFTFNINNLGGGGADGFAFIIQNSSATAIGGNGGGCTIGYDGMPDSVTVEFDTYQTSGACIGAGAVNDPAGDHISIHTLGTSPNSVMESASIGLYVPPAAMKGTGTHTVQITYVPGTINVYYDGSAAPVISAPLNLATRLSLTSGLSAWVGFTAATGGANERHEILTWAFTPTTHPNPIASGAVIPDPVVAGAAGLITVGVSPGSGLPNAITSVIVDASSVGLSGALALNDSGMGGDAVAGDNTWSTSVAFPLSTAGGAHSLPFTVTDAQSRTATGMIAFTVNGPAPGDDRRPITPTITEPALEGQIVNAADLHMVTANFASPVPPPNTPNHLCSDWELWKGTGGAGGVRIWSATCVSVGALKVHIHLGDGIFEGPYAGRTILENDTDYYLKVRHRDDSGDPVSEYSYWATRNFHTAPPTQIFPYEEDDLLAYPRADWRIDGAGPVVLPQGASLVLGSAAADLLLRIDGAASGNQITNPPALPGHVNVRVSVTAGAAPLNIPLSTLTVVDHDCGKHTLYLPAISLAAGGQALFWVSSSGSTYAASTGQTAPSFATLVRGTLSPWELRQPGYVVETFATNLQLPVNIAFVPNPGPNAADVFFYVTELYGSIKMVTRNGTVSNYATGLLNYPPTGVFPGSGECGVTGIVVEPASGDLFVTMLQSTTTGDPTQLRPKVVRMHSNDGGRTMATQTTLIYFEPPTTPSEPQGQSHQISNISIGPDGKLYVHMGDGFDQTKGQDLRYARGKVLRMNLDGTPAADNPFFASVNNAGLPALTTSSPSLATKLVWLYGLRNPFGGAWRASEGMAGHYTVENGPSNDRISIGVAGRNYLYTGSDGSMANFNILGVSTNPLTSIWYPAHGPVNMAFAQTATFGGSGFPPDRMEHAYATESGPTHGQGPQSLGKRISEFVLAPGSGVLVAGPIPLVEYTGTGFATCVGIAFGPDGLYFSDLYKDQNIVSPSDRGANILRIRYVGVASACSCPGDFNGVNGVTVQDIFDFLGAYFAGDPRADVNGSGSVTVQDIFDFLSSWFTGC